MAVASSVRNEGIRKEQSYHSEFGVSGANSAVEVDSNIPAVKQLVRVLVTGTDNADPDAGSQSSITPNVTITVINSDSGDARSVAAQRVVVPATPMSAATYEVIFDPREILSAHEQVRVNVGAAGASTYTHVQIDFLIGGEYS